MPRSPALSFRFSEADVDLIRRLAEHLSARGDVEHTQVDVIRIAVRQLARRERLAGKSEKRRRRA